MDDQNRDQERLIDELDHLRRRTAELEAVAAERVKIDEALRRSEERFRALVESASDVTVVLGSQGNVIYISPNFEKVWGFKAEGVLGQDLFKNIHPDDIPEIGKNFADIIKNPKTLVRIQIRALYPDGTWHTLDAEARNHLEEPAIGGIVVNFHDVTELKRAEEALNEKERYFRSLIENSSDGIMVLDSSGKILYESPSCSRLLGYGEGERIGQVVFDPIHPEDMHALIEGMKRIESDVVGRSEVRARHRDGSWHSFEVSATSFLDDPAVGGIVVNLRDITERKRAEEALLQGEEKYRILTERMNDIVWTMGLDFRPTYTSPSVFKVLGFTPEERVGITNQGAVTPQSYEHIMTVFTAEMERDGKEGVDPDRTITIEAEYYHKNGSTVWLEHVVSANRDEQGKITGLYAVSRDITERKRAEEALRESEEKYSTLVENATDGVSIIQDQALKFVNKRMSEMSGYTVEELTAMSTFDLVPPDFAPVLEERFRLRAEGKEVPEIFETRMLCKDGTVKEMESSTKLIQYEGRPAVIAITRDVTERKRMEEALRESEEKLRILFQTVGVGITVTDVSGKIIDVNAELLKLTGFDRKEEVIGRNGFDFIGEKDRDRAAQALSNNLASGLGVPIELTLLRKDGSEYLAETDTTVMQDSNGKQIGLIVTHRDITESRRMEEALRESEEKYRLLAENASDVIMLMDMNAKPVYFSPSVNRVLGYSVEEALEGTMEGRMTSDSMEKAAKYFLAGLEREKRHPESGLGQTLELEMIHKNGSIVVVEMMVSFIRGETGKPTGMMAILRDLTERKKAEKEIVALSNAFKAARDPIIIFDMQGNVRNLNESARKLFETDEIGVSALEPVAPEDREVVAAALQELITSGQPAVARYNIVTRSGRRVPLESSGSLMLDANGKPVGIVVVARDLTERRQAEAHQELAAEILGILNEPLALPDAIDRILAAIKRDTGFYAVGIRLKKDEDFPYFVQNGFSEDFLLTENTLVARDNRGDVCRDKDGNVSLECTCGLVLSGKTDPSNPLFTPGGSAWTNDSPTLLDVPLEQDPRLHPRNRCIHAGFQSVALMPIRSGNEIVGLLQLNDRRKGCFTPEMIRFFEGIAASIGVALMRKQSDDALRESEERYRMFAENASDALWTMDMNFNLTYHSGGDRIFGYTAEEMLGRSVDQRMTPESVQTAFKILQEELDIEQSPDKDLNRKRAIEVVQYHKNGSILHTEETVSFLRDERGKAIGIIGVTRDITERKRAEEALRESEERLRVTLEVTQIGVWEWNVKDDTWYASPTYYTMLGYEPVIGPSDRKVWLKRGHPDDLEMVANKIKDVLNGVKDSYSYEARIKHADGSYKWNRVIGHTIETDAEGKPIRLAGVRVDITERKRAEEALRESEERFREITENMLDAVSVIDDKGIVLYASPSHRKILGYRSEELVGRSVFDFLCPEDVNSVVASLDGILEKGEVSYQYRFRHADGHYVWGEASARALLDASGNASRYVIASRDITERRRAEDALRESEEKYRLLAENATDVIAVLGMDKRLTYISPSVIRLLGYTVEEALAHKMEEIYTPDSIERAVQIFTEELATEQMGQADPERTRTIELELYHKNGSVVPVEVNYRFMRDETGKPVAMLSMVRDLTERKRAEEALRESEIKYRQLFEHTLLGIEVIDAETGKIVLANHSMARMFEFKSPEEMVGIDAIKEHVLPEDMAWVLDQFAQSMADPDRKEVATIRARTVNGRLIWVTGSTTSFEYEGRPAALLSLIDVTAAKEAEEMLIRINKAVEGSSDAIGMSDPQGHHFYHNRAFTELFEYTPEELEAAGGGPAAFANKHVARKVFDTIMGGGSWFGEVEMVSKSGRRFTVLERADAIKDEKGKVIGLVGVHTDITERKKAEEKLRETRDYMENLIEHANVPMVVWTPDFRITRFNRAFERLTGMKAKSVIGKDLEILFPKGTRDRSMSFIRTAMRGARWEAVEIPIANVDGDVRTVLWNISPIYAEDGKTPMAIIAQGQDITERKQAEEALRESEELSRSMLESAAMGIYLLQNKRFIYVNPTFEKIIGYSSEELLGQEAIDYVHPDDRDIVRTKAVENIQGASVQPYEFRALRKDGRQIWVMERVTPVRYKGRRAVLASFMETTEHKKAEVELERAYEELKTAHERMVQSEKLRAMGEMASGIAHDFNNMLAVILGRTQLVIDDVKDDKVKKGIQIIEQAALDAAKTVKRLQDFARIRVEHPFEPLDVNEVVEGVLKMVESRRVELEQTKGIAIKVTHELGTVGRVSGDAAELREALLNILFNALDAMPTGGKLTVKSEQEEEWVQIIIKDTGVGIPEKVKSKVFQPFFTTKASKGSGLGLSVTYGIISRHNGMIKFDSEVGRGTTFYIRLPLAVEEVRKQARKSKAVAVKPASILTVDDEPEVLKALGLTLEYFGHWVKDFTRGVEAIKAFKDGKYDIVITDLGMPEMSGWDVARAIKKIKPEVPVLLITGWVIDLDEEKKKLVDGVIAKPFSRESIAAAVSKVFPAKKKSTANKKQAVKKSAVKKSGGKKKK